jgi:hypothetical protein
MDASKNASLGPSSPPKEVSELMRLGVQESVKEKKIIQTKTMAANSNTSCSLPARGSTYI